MKDLARVDPEIAEAVRAETRRQGSQLELIASENFVSEAVLQALGSAPTLAPPPHTTAPPPPYLQAAQHQRKHSLAGVHWDELHGPGRRLADRSRQRSGVAVAGQHPINAQIVSRAERGAKVLLRRRGW